MEATYTYDAMNNRIGIDDNGTQTWTVYNGKNPYADFNGSGTLTERYVSGPGVVNGKAVDEVLARTSSGGATAWYMTDKLGSVRDVVSSSGSGLDHIIYDSFGNIVSETNASNGDRFKYAGMEYDSVTGQYYDRAALLQPGDGPVRHAGSQGLRRSRQEPVPLRGERTDGCHRPDGNGQWRTRTSDANGRGNGGGNRLLSHAVTRPCSRRFAHRVYCHDPRRDRRGDLRLCPGRQCCSRGPSGYLGHCRRRCRGRDGGGPCALSLFYAHHNGWIGLSGGEWSRLFRRRNASSDGGRDHGGRRRASELGVQAWGNGFGETDPDQDENASIAVLCETAHRTKNIEDVAIGDLVVAKDVRTGTLRESKVVRTYQNVVYSRRFILVRGSDNTIQTLTTTDGHPFWVEGQGWTQARDLLVDSRLLQSDGSIARVRSTRREYTPHGVNMYNIEVDGGHCYFVSQDWAHIQVLVHNGDCAEELKQHFASQREPLNTLLGQATQAADQLARKLPLLQFLRETIQNTSA